MRIKIVPFSILAVIFLIGVLESCKKEKEADAIPKIEFLNAELLTDSVAVTIHFIDGDGDIGFNPGDTLPPYDCQKDPVTGLCSNINAYNIRMTYYEYENGEWIVPDPQPGINNQLKTITPEGQDKYLEGDLTYYIRLPLNLGSPSRDSIKFDVVLVDRALHLSNSVQTTLVVIP